MSNLSVDHFENFVIQHCIEQGGYKHIIAIAIPYKGTITYKVLVDGESSIIFTQLQTAIDHYNGA